MGRHSSGENNYALSANVIIAIVAVLAVIAGLIWWFGIRDTADSEQAQAEEDCIEGELTLPVAATDPALAEDLIADWAATDPVVRDHCVTPQLVTDPAAAAVYLAPDSPATETRLADSGRSPAASTHPVVATDAVGLAGLGQAPTVDGVDAAAVAYPVADQATAAVTASAALSDDTAAAAELISRDREVTVETAVGDGAELIAVPENTVPEGYEFTALPDARVSYAAIALSPADQVTEEQSRAGAEFADYTEQNSEVDGEPDTDQPDLSAVWAAVTPGETTPETTPEQAPEETEPPAADPAPVAAAPTDTLLLLDTSANAGAPFGAGSIYSTAADVLTDVALDLGGQGHGVALWNYSSPINPGVTDGWRRNVNFSDGRAAAEAVQRFGTGGAPQTRSAAVAAVANASDRSNEIGGPVRVLLITTATDRDMDDEAFRSALDNAHRGDVTLDVVHVGPHGIDPLLAELADSHTRAETPEQLSDRVRGTAGL